MRMASALMRRFYILLLASALVSACGKTNPLASELRYDAADSVALDGVISGGRAVSDSADSALVLEEVRAQLKFAAGQLNGISGLFDVPQLKITLRAIEPRADGRYEASYDAQLFVSWPKELPVPDFYTLILPAGGSASTLNLFFDTYGNEATAGHCTGYAPYGVSHDTHWYYHRPDASGCSLQNENQDNADLVARINLNLSRSPENTVGKFPEYSKIWEDRRLVVTTIFGKNAYGSTDSYDPGIAAFREFYQSVMTTFGTPSSSNLPPDTQPDAAHNDVRLKFTTASGEIDLHIYLIDSITAVGSSFRANFEQRTLISDVVSYNGHSQFGANIRHFAHLGRFAAGHYQIYLLNGCNTFGYEDGTVAAVHASANPGAAPTKYVDILKNSMPAYFSSLSRDNMALISGLVGKRATYREILERFDPEQRPVVVGEEDNRWPLPFD